MDLLANYEKALKPSPRAGPGNDSANAAKKQSSALEKAAKEAGFNSAEEWMAWNAQRERKREVQTVGAKGKGSAPTKQASPASGGVSSIFNRISDALKGK